MASTQAVPVMAVLPQLKGCATGCAVLGPVLLAAVVVLSSDHVSVLVGGLFLAVVFSLATWFIARPRRVRMWSRAPRDLGGRPGDPRRAFGFGLAVSALMTVCEILVLVFFARLWGLDQAASVGGVILGVGLAQGVIARDLRLWQEASNLVVCQRAGARRMAWTREQAEGRLVLVPADPSRESLLA